jgi:hypothetical protein
MKIVSVVPAPGTLSIFMKPFDCLIYPNVMLSPSPVP